MKYLLIRKAFQILMVISTCLIYISKSKGQSINNGSYTLVRKNTTSPQAQINGKLTDKQTRENLKIATVEIDGQQIKADTNGYYYLTVKPGKYTVIGLCYPYHRIITKKFKVRTGNIITINFQMFTDNTPTEN